MTLKEHIIAAAELLGIATVEGFEKYDFSQCARGKPVVFISDCTSQCQEEWLGLDGGNYRSVTRRIKLTAFASDDRSVAQADATLKMLEDIYSRLELDGSFSSPELSVSEARLSASHSRIMREGLITAAQLCSASEEEGKP